MVCIIFRRLLSKRLHALEAALARKKPSADWSRKRSSSVAMAPFTKARAYQSFLVHFILRNFFSVTYNLIILHGVFLSIHSSFLCEPRGGHSSTSVVCLSYSLFDDALFLSIYLYIIFQVSEHQEIMQQWETDKQTIAFIENSLKRNDDLTNKMVRPLLLLPFFSFIFTYFILIFVVLFDS